MVVLKTPRSQTSGPGRAYGLRRSHKVAFESAMPPAFMLLAVGALVAHEAQTPADTAKGDLLRTLGAVLLLTGINEIVRPDVIVHPPRVLKIITFAGITYQEADYYTRMSKEQIVRVYQLLQFPHGEITVTGLNFRLKFDSQWLFLVVLYRLCHGTDFEGMISTFGREATQICRAYNWGLDWIYRNWAFRKMHDNITEIQPHIPYYVDKIQAKVRLLAAEVNTAAEQLVAEGHHVSPWTLQEVNMAEAPLVFGVLDGTQREVQKPASGPAEPGVLAQRHPFHWEIQNAFFSGKQGYCSEKYITFNGPDGHIIYCSEPYSGRNHDADVVRRIGLHQKLVAAQAQLPPPLKCIYGDSAFKREECIQKRFAFPPTSNQSMLNLCFNKVRTSVEHIYGIVLGNFRLNMVWWKKSIANRLHKMIWPVSCFFSNILNCFNHNQISAYFKAKPMSIEAYLSGGPNAN